MRDKETFAKSRAHHANFALPDWQIDMPHSDIANSWYAQARKPRKLQNQNVLLNRLAKKYEILPAGANLSVEIVREFLTVGHFLRTRCQATGHVILTQQKLKSLKKYMYNKINQSLLKKNY